MPNHKRKPAIQPGDLKLISQQLDFLGINYYTRIVAGTGGIVMQVPGSKYTDMGWEINAPALRRLLNKITSRYDVPPIWITENGAAFADVLENGRVSDPDRIDYIRQHLHQSWLAITEDGIDVRAYLLWSLMDNFEW